MNVVEIVWFKFLESKADAKLICYVQDDSESSSADDMNLYLQFDLILSDVSAFLVDGDYSWSQTSWNSSADSNKFKVVSFLPVIDKCGVILKLQQVIHFLH